MITNILAQWSTTDVALFFFGLAALVAAAGYHIGYRVGFTTAVDICNGLSGRRAADSFGSEIQPSEPWPHR